MVKMDSSCKSVNVLLLYLICFFHRMMMLSFTTCSDAAMVAARMEVEEVERKMRRCSVEQSSALLEFKSYFNLSQSASPHCNAVSLLNPPMGSWKEGTDCCSLWDGITCDNETGQVVGIQLSCGSLQGNIPPNTTVFHHFPHLQELYLDYNDFGGSRIPSFFGHLSRLTHLGLLCSGFSGEIPMELFYLTQLMDLNLADNYGLRFKKTGFQLLVQNLTKIRELYLNSIKISSAVPISLLNLTSSNILELDGCELHGQLPDGVFNLPNLEVFDVGNNSLLTGNFPKFINSSNSLRILQLKFTSFGGQLPDSIGNLGSLEELDAIQCNIYGAIPASLSNLTSVRAIDLSNNNLSGPFLSRLIKLPNLRSLFLDHNNITGSVLEMERVLTIFTAIDLSRNKFEGEIPEIIGELTLVRGLNLSHNNLTGGIPKSLGKLTTLEWLDLSSNKLVGEIPKQLTVLNFLQVLNLSHNQLAGRIPEGAQFDTFSNDSYVGNLGLCGPPLSKSCSNPHAPQPLKEKASQSSDGFDWEVILSGYGCGLVLGLVIGYLMFSTGKPRRVMRMIEGAENKCREWQKRQSQGQGRKCRRNYGRH